MGQFFYTYVIYVQNDFVPLTFNFKTWFLAIVMTTTGFQVNDKYGPGVLKQVLLGQGREGCALCVVIRSGFVALFAMAIRVSFNELVAHA